MNALDRLRSFVRRRLAWRHGLAGAVMYAIVIAVLNLDKTLVEIAILAGRQAGFAFFFTTTLVPYVGERAEHDRHSHYILWGIILPASIVAVASVSAHYYWTDEVRNIFGPFLTSIILNSFLVTAHRAGHKTFGQQIRWFCRLTLRRF